LHAEIGRFARKSRVTEILLSMYRAFIRDGSFIDVWFSLKVSGRFSYHWERRHVDGCMFRHDNFPDTNWKIVSTFPKHYHNGSQDAVEESNIDDDPFVALRQFMDFARSHLASISK